MKTKSISFLPIFFFLLLLFPVITNAQFGKGDKLVEGGIGNIAVSKYKYNAESSNSISKNKTSAFGISIFPRMGFFIGKNLVAGATLGISYNSNKYEDLTYYYGSRNDNNDHYTTLGILPFVRYYFPSKNTRTRFYGQVGGGISIRVSDKSSYNYIDVNGNYSRATTNYPKKYKTISGEGLVGVNHFISQNVAINAALGYNYGRSKWSQTTTQTSGGTSVTSQPTNYDYKSGTLSWNVGFTMFIPCKKKK